MPSTMISPLTKIYPQRVARERRNNLATVLESLHPSEYQHAFGLALDVVSYRRNMILVGTSELDIWRATADVMRTLLLRAGDSSAQTDIRLAAFGVPSDLIVAERAA